MPEDQVPGSLTTGLDHILLAGAPAFFDSQPESVGTRFCLKKLFQRIGCGIGHVDHGLFIKTIPCKVKRHGQDSTSG